MSGGQLSIAHFEMATGGVLRGKFRCSIIDTNHNIPLRGQLYTQSILVYNVPSFLRPCTKQEHNMLKINTLRRLLPFVLLLVVVLVPITTPVRSQANTCPALVTKLVQQARNYCSTLDSGQICYASNLSPLFSDTLITLAKSGDVAPLTKLQSIAGKVADAGAGAWGIGLMKLHTTPAPDYAPLLAVLGDAQVTNLVDPSKPLPIAMATNRNQNNLNIFAGPDAKSAIIGQLVPLEQVTANGRSDGSDWLRVQYKDTLGWVGTGDIALDSEADSLNVAP